MSFMRKDVQIFRTFKEERNIFLIIFFSFALNSVGNVFKYWEERFNLLIGQSMGTTASPPFKGLQEQMSIRSSLSAGESALET